jgi:restriction endonuclease
MVKVHATRTFAPLQFEALEPHRFEDLVRDLVYDYRDWQSIEATGRSGSDEGYDIRAFERRLDAPADYDSDSERDNPVTVEGNRWMIQCKREKELGPGRIKAIIADAVQVSDPPYGYILAAPANFSKKAYDAFRVSLSERGVQEFHLFGRAELEDMLYMPKNDRILFAFFGVSLTSKKRTRVTEIRAAVNNKNKLWSILGGGDHFDLFTQAHVLIRDINDTHYPRKDECPDFDRLPRWKEYIACEFYADGLRFHIREHFAYINREKKEWDCIPVIDLLHRESEADRDDRQSLLELRRRVTDFWEHLPRTNQAKLIVDGIVLYERFAFIDKVGDPLFRFPHLYVEYSPHGPFDGHWKFLQPNRHTFVRLEEYTRVEIFPADFPNLTRGMVYRDKSIWMGPQDLARLQHDSRSVFLDGANEYAFLKPRDVIQVASRGTKQEPAFAALTHRFECSVSEFYEQDPHPLWELQQRLGREPDPAEIVHVLELKIVYEAELDQARAI